MAPAQARFALPGGRQGGPQKRLQARRHLARPARPGRAIRVGRRGRRARSHPAGQHRRPVVHRTARVFHTDRATNRPVKACEIEQVDVTARGSCNLHNYRIRMLLTKSVTWRTSTTPRIRGGNTPIGVAAPRSSRRSTFPPNATSPVDNRPPRTDFRSLAAAGIITL